MAAHQGRHYLFFCTSGFASFLFRRICNPTATLSDFLHFRIINAYTLCGRIANPTEHKR